MNSLSDVTVELQAIRNILVDLAIIVATGKTDDEVKAALKRIAAEDRKADALRSVLLPPL